MSYSFSIPAGPKSTLNERAQAAWSQYEATLPDWQPTAEVGDHVAAVLTALSDLAKTCGLDTDEVGASVSGHANPSHAPVDGYAPEQISISIYVSPVPKPGPEQVATDAAATPPPVATTDTPVPASGQPPAEDEAAETDSTATPPPAGA